MKKILKFSYMVLLSLMAFAISSCTSDYDYTGAPKVANEVYFSNTQESTIQLSKSNSSFDITLHRVSKDGELTVPLTYTAGEGSIFTVPSSVTFADGETEAPIKVTYNPDDVKYGTYTGGTITVNGEGIDTTYGIGSFTFTAGATEWADINTNKSMGSYREDVLTTFFNVGNSVDEVKIQQSVVEPGKYRIVNPYESWKNEEGVTYDADNDHYWVINATDPDYAYVETCRTGLAVGEYGEITVTSFVAYYLAAGKTLDEIKSAHPEYFGTLKDGVITMPQNSLLISMANYNNGGLYKSNKNGLFAVALPGSVIANYSAEATYKGRFTDGKDNDFAEFNIEKSDDVAKVKYALVPASSDLNATASGIMDGSVESEELTQSGDVQVAFDATGKYTLVMVLYNAANEAVGVETLDVSLKSSKDAAEVWNDVAAGTMTIGVKSLGSMLFQQDPGVLLGKAVVQEGILSQSASDPTKFRITPFLDDSTPLEFTVAEDGSIVTETQETGLSAGETPVLVTDIVSFFGATSDNGQYLLQNGIYSHYDSAKKLYTFYNIYTDADGNGYAFESDTFEVTTEGEARSLAKAIAKAKKIAAQRTTKKISAKSHKLYVAKGGELAM